MARVFIRYRSTDSAASAGRLFDRLREHFGEANVLRDLDTIPPGDEFARIITETIGQCGVLIAVIGSAGLTAADAAGKRRLEEPRDFVRAEIQEALRLFGSG